MLCDCRVLLSLTLPCNLDVLSQHWTEVSLPDQWHHGSASDRWWLSLSLVPKAWLFYLFVHVMAEWFRMSDMCHVLFNGTCASPPFQASSFLLCKVSAGGILQGQAALSLKFSKEFGVQLRRKPNSQGRCLNNFRPNLAFACLLPAALWCT